MANKDISIEFIKMKFADAVIPTFRNPRNDKTYLKWGSKDDYGDYLAMLYNKSSKHSAIINGKVVYIYGNGLECDETNAAGLQFLKRINDKGQKANDLAKKVIQDIEMYGGFALQCIPKLGGGFNYYHLRFNNVRTNYKNTIFKYKENWKDYAETEQTFEAFTPKQTEKATILYFKEYRSEYSPYPFPSWVACCNWIESDIEVSKATLTKALTGFSASKMINFFNGEPDSEEKKRDIEQRLKNKITGAEGDAIAVSYNNDKTQAPEVLDLGSSDLTKEDFTNVDNLITNNIFAGHSVTHPLLFGIQQEGKLGGATELKIAFDIFKNTYATAKQIQVEDVFNYLAKCNGITVEFKLKDIEPVGLDLNPVDFKDSLPKEWILEKLGIDPIQYGVAATQPGAIQQQSTNDALVNITGRQQQALLRISRLFNQGKLTKQQAAIQLKGFGFTDEDINNYLGIDDNPNTLDTKFSTNEDSAEFDLVMAEFGSNVEDYTILRSMSYMDDESMEFKMCFDAATELTDLETKVKDMLQNNPKLTNEELAQATEMPLTIIEQVVKKLIDNNIIQRLENGAIKVIVKTPKVELPKIEIFYTYEKRKDVAGQDILPTSRPFCKKMVGLSKTKMWSRKDIQNISQRLGYNVFLRAGGFWNNNGTIEYHCRHEWVANAVIKKQK